MSLTDSSCATGRRRHDGAINCAVSEHRLDSVESAVSEIRDAIGQIASAMSLIARLDERHSETRDSLGRAFNKLGEIDKTVDEIRIQIVALKGEITPLKESRGWVVAGVLGIASLVGVAVIGLVLVGAN